MKVAILSAANNVHTERWANGLAEKGLDVILLSIHPCTINLNSNIKFVQLPFLKGFGYFLAAFKLRNILKLEKPDILNAHYATGYGFLARMSLFHPLMISVWGSDVYLFPDKSVIHKWFVKSNLGYADTIGSTSYCMKERICELVGPQATYITPFGVETNVFQKDNKVEGAKQRIVIGTVKSLKYVYGIDLLIKVFAIVQKELESHYDIVLEVCGKGDQLVELEELAVSLGVQDSINFLGHVKHSEVPGILNRFDIYMALSRSESFGVAILEASACSLPVIVSDTPGLMEVVVANETGLIVQIDNLEYACEALKKLIINPTLRTRLGNNGRNHVMSHYTWEESLKLMILAYKDTIVN